jgi:hypothetical protein
MVSAQRVCQREPELDGQHPGVAVLGQVQEGLEGLLEGGHGLAEGGAVVGPGTSLPAVGHGLLPHLTPQSMVGEPLDLFAELVGIERLDGLYDPGVEGPPLLLLEASIGHLVRERMLESVGKLGEQASLIEELGPLQVG